MKFSHQFRKQQDPAWLHAYVKYDRSKALIKALTNQAHGDTHHQYNKSQQAMMTKRTRDNRVDLETALVAVLQDDFRLVTGLYRDLDMDVIHGVQQYLLVCDSDPTVTQDQGQLELKTKIANLHRYGAMNTIAFLRLFDKLDCVKVTIKSPLLLQRQAILAANFSQRTGFREVLNKLRNHPTILRTAISIESGLSSITSALESQLGVNYNLESGVSVIKSAVHSPSLEERLIHAAAIGDEDTVRSVVELGVDPDTPEPITNRTPLCYASMNGESSLVRFLLNTGANPDSMDLSGRTIAEHAGYRGHHEVMRMVQAASKKDLSITDTLPVRDFRRMHYEKDSNVFGADVSAASKIDSTSIIVDIGSPHSITTGSPIEYTIPNLIDAVGSLSLELSISDAARRPYLIKLPVMEDLSNKPCVYDLDSALKRTQLEIKLYRSQGSDKVLEGTGRALIEVPDGFMTAELETIGQTRKILIHGKQHDTLVAVLSYTLMVVKPVPAMAKTASSKSWNFGNGIGGHRGFGQNNLERRSLQIGENTMEAFEAAVRSGAAFVEFDVQVTKDLVPVVYHDFLVSETGIDAPVHTLSYRQFQSVNDSYHQHEPCHRRARSLSPTNPIEALRLRHRQEHILRTTEGRIMGFKPNTRGNFIQAPFTSLQRACIGLEPDVPFDIELKYPMLSETVDWQTSPNWLPLNSYLDAILTTLASLPLRFAARKILLSSFSPDVCIALVRKRVPYPVYFLNDGRAPTPDPRASSLQSALRFASAWGLDGIVLESTPLIACPRLVHLVKAKGLKLATYGASNNESGSVRSQREHGIDGTIVDRVKDIFMDCENCEVNVTSRRDADCRGGRQSNK